MQNLPCIENSFIMQSETVISIWSVYQKLDVVSNTRINRLKWLDLMASWLISPEGQL